MIIFAIFNIMFALESSSSFIFVKNKFNYIS